MGARLQVVQSSLHFLYFAEQQVDVFKILNVVLFGFFLHLGKPLLQLLPSRSIMQLHLRFLLTGFACGFGIGGFLVARDQAFAALLNLLQVVFALQTPIIGLLDFLLEATVRFMQLL